MIQEIAAICTIITFLVGIYSTFVNNSEWLRYSFFGFALLCFIVFLYERKIKSKRTSGAITQKGTQPIPCPYEKVEVEVFYPKPFKHTPNLTIRFPKRQIPDDLRGHIGTPIYEITEQRPDGFKIIVLSLGIWNKPIVKWQANGQLKD